MLLGRDLQFFCLKWARWQISLAWGPSGLTTTAQCSCMKAALGYMRLLAMDEGPDLVESVVNVQETGEWWVRFVLQKSKLFLSSRKGQVIFHIITLPFFNLTLYSHSRMFDSTDSMCIVFVSIYLWKYIYISVSVFSFNQLCHTFEFPSKELNKCLTQVYNVFVNLLNIIHSLTTSTSITSFTVPLEPNYLDFVFPVLLESNHLS